MKHILHACPNKETAKMLFEGSDLPGVRNASSQVIISGDERHLFRHITCAEDVIRLAGLPLYRIEDHGYTCEMKDWSRLQMQVRHIAE